MADFYAKTGHTGPSLKAVLYNPDGTIANLSNGTLKLNVYKPNGSLLFSKSAVIVSPTEGQVRYDWAATDLTTAGLYGFEFVFYPAAGGSIPYPTNKHWTLQVTASRP